MILADKIIDLRKKNGWSQEELAEKMDISRQSVSKWEGAQSVPDMARIVRLSEIFGVSTDYLLKDELVSSDQIVLSDSGCPIRTFSLDEASSFLHLKAQNACSVSIGVLLCVLSPVPLILLGGAEEYGKIALTENQAGGLGLIVFFLLAGAAVVLFVTSGLRMSSYEWLEREPVDTLYGVSGMARERREQFRPVYVRQLTTGILFCVLSMIPLGIVLFFFESEFTMVIALASMMGIAAVGIMLIVRVSIVWGSFQILLEEGDYSREVKEDSKAHGRFGQIYWLLITAGFLAWGFLSDNWQRAGIIWPVAGVAYGAFVAIAGALRKKDGA